MTETESERKHQALDQFATYINPQRVRVMRAAGLDIVEAERDGPWVFDVDGRRFLDCFTSAGSFNVGRRNARVVAAAHAAVDRLDHGNFLLCSSEKAALAAKLAEITPGDLSCTMFGTGGGEAIDFAIKLARGSTGRPTVVSTVNGYHGHTGFALSAAGREAFRRPFEPLMPEFVQVPFGDVGALEQALGEHTAAVLLEPIQGESGIHPASAHFLRILREVCDRYGALLMFDEVQCGLGRTGDWCGWRSIAPDVVPDAVSWAKGIAGGFPLGAIWVRDRPLTLNSGGAISLADLFGPGTHGTTFGGTPLVCSGALEVLRVIEEEGLLANARTIGAYAKESILGLKSPFITEVRGVGLMLGIQLTASFATHAGSGTRPPSLWLVDRLHEAGMLTIPAGTHTIRWLPPLNVTRDEVDQAVAILGGVLRKNV